MPSERDVRDWLRQVWPADSLQWIEPSRGSTVGYPDAIVTLRNGTLQIPLELKLWKETRKGVRCHLRPAQIRWHVMQAKAGNKSALLVGIEKDSKVGVFGLYLIPGWNVPRRPYPDVNFWLNVSLRDICDSDKRDKEALFNMQTILNDSKFWKAS